MTFVVNVITQCSCTTFLYSENKIMLMTLVLLWSNTVYDICCGWIVFKTFSLASIIIIITMIIIVIIIIMIITIIIMII